LKLTFNALNGLFQLKSSLSKAFSRPRRKKKTKLVRSAGEAWSDTETEDLLTAAAAAVVSDTRSAVDGAAAGALSMPNSPSLNTTRLLRPVTPAAASAGSGATTPSPSRVNAGLPQCSPPPAESVALACLFYYLAE